MNAFLSAVSVWLHTAAATVFIGHYILLAVVYLPALTKNGVDAQVGAALSNISKASRPWLYASIVVFAVTGTYLTFIDGSYRGLGNFSNTWSVLMLVKHILIVGMVAAGFWFHGILHAGSVVSSTQALATFRRFVYGMAVTGLGLLLLTAAAGEF